MNWESSTDIYMLSSVKQITSGKLPYNREPHPALCDNLEGWDGGMGGRLNREGRYICMCYIWGFPGGAGGKNPTCQCKSYKRHRFSP